MSRGECGFALSGVWHALHFFLHSGLQDDPRFSGLESVLNGSATLEQAASTVPNGALDGILAGFEAVVL